VIEVDLEQAVATDGREQMRALGFNI